MGYTDFGTVHNFRTMQRIPAEKGGYHVYIYPFLNTDYITPAHMLFKKIDFPET